jgi:hypothetical protein
MVLIQEEAEEVISVGVVEISRVEEEEVVTPLPMPPMQYICRGPIQATDQL